MQADEVQEKIERGRGRRVRTRWRREGMRSGGVTSRRARSQGAAASTGDVPTPTPKKATARAVSGSGAIGQPKDGWPWCEAPSE